MFTIYVGQESCAHTKIILNVGKHGKYMYFWGVGEIIGEKVYFTKLIHLVPKTGYIYFLINNDVS